MRLLFISLLLLVLSFNASGGNKDSTRNFKLYSVQQFGPVFGSLGLSYSVNLSAGVSYKKRYKFGYGVSFNQYYIRTMPLFLETRYEMGDKTRAVLFAAGGFNLFPNYNPNFYYNNDNIVKQQTGSYAEAGIGFKTRLGGNLFYNTSFSYIYKKSRYIREGLPRWDGNQWIVGGEEPVSVENMMFSLRFGLDF